jgi:hypothetical protein
MESADIDSITQLFIRLSNIPEKADIDMSIIEKLVKKCIMAMSGILILLL